MLIVPLDAVPSQTLAISLNSQACGIHVYLRSTGMYLDLSVNDVLIVGGVICHDRNLLVRSAYLGFSGDLAFVDTQGADDPTSDGLGGRFLLEYFLPSELVPAALPTTFWVPATPLAAPPPPTGPAPPAQIIPGAPSGLTIT